MNLVASSATALDTTEMEIDAGVPIVLVRTQAGQVKGYVNICSHRGAPVAVGKGNAKGMALTCPYHGRSYTLDGGLLEIPVAERDGLICLCAQPGGRLDVDAVDDGIGADLKAFGMQDHHLFDTVTGCGGCTRWISGIRWCTNPCSFPSGPPARRRSSIFAISST